MATRTINIRIGGIVLFALMVLCAFLFWKYKRDTNQMAAQIAEQNEQLDYYTVVVGSLKEQVAEARLLVWSRKDQLMLTQAQVERLKKQNINHVNVIGQLKVTVASLQDSLMLKSGKDTVKVVEYITESGDVNSCVPIPFDFEIQDEWMYSAAGVDATGTGWTSFLLKETPIDLTLGSRGVFKKHYVSAVSTPNPYVGFTANDFQVVQQDIKIPPIVYGTTGGFLAGFLTCFFLSR